MEGKITNSLKSHLMQKWLSYASRSLCLIPKKKWTMTLFLLNFLSKYLDMYRMDTVLSLILLVSEMLKTSRSKVEAHFIKKLSFVPTNVWHEMPWENVKKDNRRPCKIHSSTRIVTCANCLIISYILQRYPSRWAISITEMHCPIQAVPKLTQK